MVANHTSIHNAKMTLSHAHLINNLLTFWPFVVNYCFWWVIRSQYFSRYTQLLLTVYNSIAISSYT